MPQGKGTYGSKVGRPSKKKGSLLNDDRESYILGGLASKLSKRLLKTFGKNKKVKELTKDIANQKEYIKNKGWKKELEQSEPGELTKNEQAELTPEFAKYELEELEGSLERKLGDLNADKEIGKVEIAAEKEFYERREGKAEGGSLLNDDRQQYGLGAVVKSISKYLIKKDSKGKIINISEAKKELKKLKDDLKERKEAATTGQELDEVELLEEAIDDIQADIIKTIENVPDDYSARGMVAEGGDVKDQMDGLAISVAPIAVEETQTMPDGTEMAGATHEEYEEQTMLPDEEMEEDYVDYVMEETLSNEDRNYLIDTLEKDDRLSEIFDQVVESATEFSGSGPIEGPGSEKSDSIPARLSDGEFVFTAKATEEIGSDNLMSMMNDAEAAAEQRQGVAYGGMIDEEDRAIPLPTQGSKAALGRIPNVVKQSRQVEEEMLKSSPRRYYVPVSG